jgi:hypothetical protein
VVIWNSTLSSTIILNADDQLLVDALERLDRVRRRRSVLLSYRIESVEPGLNVSNALVDLVQGLCRLSNRRRHALTSRGPISS